MAELADAADSKPGREIAPAGRNPPRVFVKPVEAFERAISHLVPHLEAIGASKPQFSPHEPLRFEDQVRVLLAAKVPVLSFIYCIPHNEILEECHRQDIVTIGTATTPDEAIALEQAGVDVVVASGFEAGGHRGSFLLLRRFSDRDDLPDTAGRGCGRGTSRSSWRNRGRPRHRCSFRARRRRCADGNGLSCLRRVWSKRVAPRGDPERKGEPNFAYPRLHRTPGTRHPQSTSGADEPTRRRHSPVPVATGPYAEPRRAGAAGRTERTPSLMGRPKRWTRSMPRNNSASAIARRWSIRATGLNTAADLKPGSQPLCLTASSHRMLDLTSFRACAGPFRPRTRYCSPDSL